MGIDDYSVLLGLVSFFQCGKVYISSVKELSTFKVTKLQDLVEKIKPFLQSVKISTCKQGYVSPSFEAWNILYTKGIQKDVDLRRVVDLVYNINQAGKLRKMEKESYLSLFSNECNNITSLCLYCIFIIKK